MTKLRITATWEYDPSLYVYDTEDPADQLEIDLAGYRSLLAQGALGDLTGEDVTFTGEVIQ